MRKPLIWLIIWGAFPGSGILGAPPAENGGHDRAPVNLALGRPYTLVPSPSYRLCTDPGDRKQLTDGVFAQGYFWTQLETVGWTHARPVVITMDLGSDLPIRGVSFNTAAGVAGVEWPAAILVLVSVDGRAYHDSGDLVALSRKDTAPPEGEYAVHRFRTDRLRTHGRYVKLIVDPAGAYCFVDEIEVFRGEDAWKDLVLPGKEIRHPLEYFSDTMLDAGIKRRIGRDLESARAEVLNADLPRPLTDRLMHEVSAIEQAISDLPQANPETFRAVFPLNEVHRRAFALHGAVRAALGRPPLLVWGANPWGFLRPTELPEQLPKPEIAVAAMRGESRAGTLNLTNCTEHSLTVSLAFEGLPGAPAPKYVTVHEVAWTDTREGVAVAAALPRVTPRQGSFPIHVPAGMTRQVWMTFTPRGLEPGVHRGKLAIAGGREDVLRVPVSLRVFDIDFPDQPTLHVGGWDYTDADGMYGVTPENRAALIAHLQGRYVDSPWATSSVMPVGTFNEAGDLVTPPDTTRFDTWLARWRGARRYCVFNAVGDHIAGTRIGDPLFAKKVGSWIRFWVQHAKAKGLATDQLALLLVDEPHENAQDRIIVAWARAVKAAEPDVLIWEDPTYRDPAAALPEMMAVADVLCPNRPMLLAQGKPFVDFYRRQRAAGRHLDLYSCSGPSRLLDPYSYHRLQAWSCFQLGAESTYFWAFGDTGGGHSWNEYTTRRTSFTPLFLAPDSVTPGKHMEAIRESVEDFEYLVMLRRRVAALSALQPEHPLLARAKSLLAKAADRVLGAEQATALDWRAPKDRSLADAVRIEIGTLLEKLN